MKSLREQRQDGAWFAGRGEMSERIRSHDWPSTPLGALETWPASLRSAVNLVVASPLPCLLTWGEQGTQIYNDAFLPILGSRHSRALGQAFEDCWHGAFPGTGLPLHKAATPGLHENQRLFLTRADRPRDSRVDELFFTHAVTWILDEGGETSGHLHQLVDVTAAALGARRMRALAQLSSAPEADTLEGCLAAAALALAPALADLPLLLFYLVDDSGTGARLVAGTKLPAGGPGHPPHQGLAAQTAETGAWPLAAALKAHRPLAVTDVQARFPGLTAGPYPEPIANAFVLPAGDGPAGAKALIVAGVSQRARLDDDYTAFYGLLAAGLGNVIARASAADDRRRGKRAATLATIDPVDELSAVDGPRPRVPPANANGDMRNQLVRQLAEANKELEAFSYSVSHDLRTPLRAIDGFSRALLTEQGAKLDEQGRRYLERIRAGTQRMAELIDDLLSLSRITRATLKRERVDLSAIARRVLNDLATRAPARTVEAVVAEGLVAQADARLITALFENLLGNAWKFSSKIAHARIEVTSEPHHGGVAFVVRDNGAGFNMDYATKLFEPFQRLHAASEFPGAGIGLATVHRIVTRHGGRIWAQAAPDQGAAFHFTLGEPA